MKIIQVSKLPNVDYREYVKRTALEKDFKTLIKEPCILMEGETVLCIYNIVDIDTAELVKDLKSLKYHEGYRTRGLKSLSRIFGFRPRSPIRGEYCSSTSLATENPEVHARVCNLALDIEKYYEKYSPKVYAEHKAETDSKIKDIYKIQGKSLFTSGIINKNNPLKYHFDSGNFNGVYSMMIVFKSGIQGGYLSLPEYGIGLELPNNAVLMFDGQSILHGVTPITKTTPESHRFSIVYYSLKQMWKCLALDEELARIRNKKRKREVMRFDMPPEHYATLKGRRGKQ